MSEQNVTPGKFNKKGFRPSHLLWVVVGILVVISLVSSFYTVDQTEQAVVLRFGKYVKTAIPGLHSKLPFGVDRVFKVPTEVVQTVEFGFRTISPGINTIYSEDNYAHEARMLTGDLNIVDVNWIMQYKIVDPQAWLFNVDNTPVYNSKTREKVDNRIKTIRDISQSTINMLVGDRAYFDVIGEERSNIESQSAEIIDDILASYGLGVHIINVRLQNIVPPKGEVQAAFEDVNMAYQDMERMINEGQEAYNREIPKARGEARQMLEEAEAYKARRVNNAQGNVARFKAVYSEYKNAQGITRDRLYYEMIEEVFGNSEDLDLIDRNLENFLPLKDMSGSRKGGDQ